MRRNNRTVQRIIKSMKKEFGENSNINSKKAWNWYRTHIRKSMSSMKQSAVMRDKPNLTGRPLTGKMYFFVYDALGKDTLPYWDAFPLILCIGTTGTHFHGINMHYIPPALRTIVFAEMMELKNSKGYNNKTRVIATWERLQHLASSRFLSNAVKQYRMDQVRSRFIKIDSELWGMSINLPVERFQKASRQKVWSDTRKGRRKG